MHKIAASAGQQHAWQDAVAAAARPTPPVVNWFKSPLIAVLASAAQELLWIARTGLKEPLPPDWKPW